MSKYLTLTEEELVLTLHCYAEIGPNEPFSDSHPQIQWLSSVPRQLPVHPPEERPVEGGFRTPPGLASRVRAFKHIDEGRQSRSLKKYRKVWAEYEGNPDALKRDAEALLERFGVSASRDEDVLREIQRRLDLWERLQEEGNVSGASRQLLREEGIYGGASGIWVDKSRTSDLVD